MGVTAKKEEAKVDQPVRTKAELKVILDKRRKQSQRIREQNLRSK